MWLYIPSTSSPSAPAAQALISASSWQFQVLEASAWWRGKRSPARSWWQRWNKDCCLKLLCGAMPEPSTADRGAALWMASLAASRASRTALPDEKAGVTTRATSGQRRGASSSSRGRGSSSSKTSPACSRRGLTKSLERSGFGETYESWAMRLRADCSRRQKLAQATDANGFLFSAWPTAAVTDSNGARNKTSGRSNPNSKHHDGMTLNDAIVLWPTMRAADGATAVLPERPRGGGRG